MATIEEVINKTVNELCDELTALKKSYFSPKGKPGAGWKPLTKETLRVKEKRNIETYNSFNKGTGKLQESVDVTYAFKQHGNTITATLTASSDDDEITGYLTKNLGRDFLVFGELEKQFINEQFVRLMSKNAK